MEHLAELEGVLLAGELEVAADEDEVAAALEGAQHEFDEADTANGAVPK